MTEQDNWNTNSDGVPPTFQPVVSRRARMQGVAGQGAPGGVNPMPDAVTAPPAAPQYDAVPQYDAAPPLPAWQPVAAGSAGPQPGQPVRQSVTRQPIIRQTVPGVAPVPQPHPQPAVQNIPGPQWHPPVPQSPAPGADVPQFPFSAAGAPPQQAVPQQAFPTASVPGNHPAPSIWWHGVCQLHL